MLPPTESFNRATAGLPTWFGLHLAPLLLRIALAVIFIYHGSTKIGGAGNEAGSAWAREMPNPPPRVQQTAVAWGELTCGICMAIGFLTRLAAVGIIIIMAGAIYHVTGAHGFDATHNGFEYNFAIIMMSLALLVSGGGKLTLARELHWPRRQPPSPPPSHGP
jgi:putative oxidoreductase